MQRYATTAVTASLFHEVANEAGITIQDVMVRNDSACSSTVGPITSANLGMRVIDVGIPQFRVASFLLHSELSISLRFLSNFGKLCTMYQYSKRRFSGDFNMKKKLF